MKTDLLKTFKKLGGKLFNPANINQIQMNTQKGFVSEFFGEALSAGAIKLDKATKNASGTEICWDYSTSEGDKLFVQLVGGKNGKLNYKVTLDTYVEKDMRRRLYSLIAQTPELSISEFGGCYMTGFLAN